MAVCTRAPSISMRVTLRCWRTTSTSPMQMTHSRPMRAALAAVPTPCWPAPVSAMTRVLPMRLASRHWPMVLLTLWAPRWLRSSRLSQICAPPSFLLRLRQWKTGLGRPAKCSSRRCISRVNSGSARASLKAWSSSSRRALMASGTYWPPYAPKKPLLSGWQKALISLLMVAPLRTQRRADYSVLEAIHTMLSAGGRQESTVSGPPRPGAGSGRGA